MTRVLLNVVLLLIICLPSLIAIRCKPPEHASGGEVTEITDENFRSVGADKKTRRHRQKTFIRNPNYISANKEFDEMAEKMYMLTLPKPHPGALAGSTHGCVHFEEERKVKFLEVGI